jgi:hypothetical protein
MKRKEKKKERKSPEKCQNPEKKILTSQKIQKLRQIRNFFS